MIHNTKIINFNVFSGEYGFLVPLEGTQDIPFQINRVYYIYGVPNKQRRGFHSHNELQQVLICVHGSVKILVKTPFEEEVVQLDRPTQGLFIGPMVWREMFDWQGEGVLLVLASKHFSESDYIRNYAVYEPLARSYFGGDAK